jgi:hypothetical protein
VAVDMDSARAHHVSAVMAGTTWLP